MEDGEGASNCIKHLLLNTGAIALVYIYVWLCVHSYVVKKTRLILDFDNRCFAHTTGVGLSFAAFDC